MAAPGNASIFYSSLLCTQMNERRHFKGLVVLLSTMMTAVGYGNRTVFQVQVVDC